ncbi:MAG: 8-amino-7-oxononanoate synthase, partial [Cyanobacteria bacterium J06632_3]
MSSPYSWLRKSLNTLHQANWYRSVREIEGLSGPEVMVEGRWMVNLASNDYLGFAGDVRLKERAI